MSPEWACVLTVGSHRLNVKISFFRSKQSKWESHGVRWAGRRCEGIAASSFPAVLICHSNEQAAAHGHQAIIFGYHANSEHHGMLLYREICPGSITMVGKEQMQAIIWRPFISVCLIVKREMPFLQGRPDGVETDASTCLSFTSSIYFIQVFFLLFMNCNYVKWTHGGIPYRLLYNCFVCTAQKILWTSSVIIYTVK